MDENRSIHIDPSERESIEKTYRVTSYMDDIIDSLKTGRPVKVNVPDLRTGNSFPGSLSNESNGIEIGLDGMSDAIIKSSSFGDVGLESFTKTSSSVPSSNINKNAAPDKTYSRMEISSNQKKAIQKFPALIEFLGQPNGEKIAQNIVAEINILLSKKIGENSQSVIKEAVACRSDRQNIKQYFQGSGWVCCVTASGPFRGDEAIVYSRDKDIASILRKRADKFDLDVTDMFNIIHESADVSEE